MPSISAIKSDLIRSARLRGPSASLFFIALVSLMLWLGGCAMVGPDYVQPTPPEPPNWLESENPQIESTETDFSRWWSVFNDPVLNTLVQTAYQQNLPDRKSVV